MALNIDIRTIPHGEQRYPTGGDWRTGLGGLKSVSVSAMGSWKYEALVAVHELIEGLLCFDRCISDDNVTAFDMQFEENRVDDSEPGDDPKAPYYKEHQFATRVEKMLAEELGVDWDLYGKAVANL